MKYLIISILVLLMLPPIILGWQKSREKHKRMKKEREEEREQYSKDIFDYSGDDL